MPRRATVLLFEQATRDLPYDLQQWLVEQPGLVIQEDDIVKAFSEVPPERLHKVLQTMVQASVLLPIGNGVYYKNMRTIEARGLPSVGEEKEISHIKHSTKLFYEMIRAGFQLHPTKDHVFIHKKWKGEWEFTPGRKHRAGEWELNRRNNKENNTDEKEKRQEKE